MRDLHVREISTEATYPLRSQVLRPHQPLESCQYPSDSAPGCFHLGVERQDKIVCIGSFFPEVHKHFDEESQFRLRGMATAKDFRGQGLGRRLVETALEKLAMQKIQLLWCNARTVAVPFYAQMGFETFGEQFEIPVTGPHFVMSKRVFLGRD